MAKTNNDWKSMLVKAEDSFNEFFVKKAPALPENIRGIIVTIMPWLVLIGVLFSIPAILALLGLSAFLPFLSPLKTAGANFIGVVVLAVSVVLQILALPGLFNRQRKGWEYMFYSELVGLVGTVLSLSVGGLIGAVLGFYILFQVRSHYK